MKVNGSRPGELNFIIPFSSGALTPKHIKKIGPALPLFLHYEDRVTTGKGSNGFVLGGKSTSDEEPAKRLGLHPKTVGRHRERLEKYRYIRTKATGRGYTIIVRKSKKWIVIQRGMDKSALSDGAEVSDQMEQNRSIRSDRSALSGGSLPINDEARTKQGHLPTGFEDFWKAYPKKKAKPEAVRAWKKIKTAEIPAIMASIEAHKKTEDWNKNNGQYIPYPATFLNQRRWEDEPTEVNEKRGIHGTDTRRKPDTEHPSRFRGVERPASEFAQPTH